MNKFVEVQLQRKINQQQFSQTLNIDPQLKIQSQSNSQKDNQNISTIKNQMQSSFSQLFVYDDNNQSNIPSPQSDQSPQFTLGNRYTSKEIILNDQNSRRCRSSIDDYCSKNIDHKTSQSLTKEDYHLMIKLKKLTSQLQDENKSIKEENTVLKALLKQVCQEFSSLKQQVNFKPIKIQKQQSSNSVYQKILNQKQQNSRPKLNAQSRVNTQQPFRNSMNLSSHLIKINQEQLWKQSISQCKSKQSLHLDIHQKENYLSKITN